MVETAVPPDPKPARKRFRFTLGNLTDEERRQRAALAFPDDDTADWFSHDQTLDNYESQLGFDRKDLEGKVVVDLGTSPGDQLARDVKAAGINATVIGVSPDLRREFIANHPRIPAGWKRKGIAGIGQALPFKDNSVDVILGAYSVTWKAANNIHQVEAWVSEIGRVLKEGGEARVGPTYNDAGGYAMGKDMIHVKEFGQKVGLAVSVHEGKNEDGSHHSYILLQRPLPAAA